MLLKVILYKFNDRVNALSGNEELRRVDNHILEPGA
jgi:hypothetical protein